MGTRSVRSLGLSLATLGLAATAWAQSTTGRISGTVADSQVVCCPE